MTRAQRIGLAVIAVFVLLLLALAIETTLLLTRGPA